MRERGYNGTGVKDIVNAAGVPKGSFYNYFESKQAFAVAALEQVAEGNLRQMRSILDSAAESPLKRLEEFFIRNIEHLKRNGRFTGGCFIGTICQEIADADDTIRETGHRLLKLYEKVFIDCLRQARECDELAAGTDIDALGGFIFSAWEGSLLKMKAAKNAVALDQFLSEVKILLRRHSS